MPVALHDLGADRVHAEAEVRQDRRFDLRPEMAVRPDRPRDLAGTDLVDGRRQPRPAAVDLERPARELEAHRGGLGVDRVGPAHHRRVRLGPGTNDERFDEAIGVAQQPLPGGPELEGEPGIHDVAAGQPEMEIATLRTDRFGDLRDEGDDVVVGRALDLVDALDIDACSRLERFEDLGRDQATRGEGAADGQLDPEHGLESGLFRPDGAHLGERVAADHPTAPAPTTDAGATSTAMSWRRCKPSNAISSAAAEAMAAADVVSLPCPTTARTRPPAVR